MTRPKHPDQDIEEIIRSAEKQGWRVSRGKKYYKMYCACGDHIKTVHITPKRDYATYLRQELGKKTCWRADQ